MYYVNSDFDLFIIAIFPAGYVYDLSAYEISHVLLHETDRSFCTFPLVALMSTALCNFFRAICVHRSCAWVVQLRFRFNHTRQWIAPSYKRSMVATPVDNLWYVVVTRGVEQRNMVSVIFESITTLSAKNACQRNYLDIFILPSWQLTCGNVMWIRDYCTRNGALTCYDIDEVRQVGNMYVEVMSCGRRIC
jgi:hypothetical protein